MENGGNAYRRYLDGDDGGMTEIIRLYKDGLIFYIMSTITICLDVEAGQPVRLPSISCLSYNKRSNWLTNVYLGFLCPLFRLLAILLLQRSI